MGNCLKVSLGEGDKNKIEYLKNLKLLKLMMSAKSSCFILILFMIAQTECRQCYHCKSNNFFQSSKGQNVCKTIVNCGDGACTTDITKDPHIPSCETRITCEKKKNLGETHCCYDDLCNSSYNTRTAFYTVFIVFMYSLYSFFSNF